MQTLSSETRPSSRRLVQATDVWNRTLSGMFPDLDKDVIDDVVRMKEGRSVVPTCHHSLLLTVPSRVGLAVDACLALST